MNGKRKTLYQFIKNSKQLINNYSPVSLLPLCSKTFEKLIFGSIPRFMIKNNLLNSFQSGFKPNNSCNNRNLFY